MVDDIRDRYHGRRDYQTPLERRPVVPVKRQPEPFLSLSMSQEKPHVAKSKKQRSWPWRKLAFIILPLCLIIAIVAGSLLYRNHHKNQSSYAHVFTQLQANSSFPLFSPTTLPPQYTFDENSINNQGNVISFNLQTANSKLIVTQQARPPVMEEVKKLTEFTVDGNKAYVADLNGHNTGFILGDKTLVIFSSDQFVDPNQLQSLMTTFHKNS